jgi:hypothetical protein
MDCETIASMTFVACAAIVWYAVDRKCRATWTDIERWLFNDVSEARWAVFRAASVIVVIGGLMHTNSLVMRLFGRRSAPSGKSNT